MSVLHRKLIRDLWRIRAQGAAIAVVVSLGVMVQVMMSGLVISLAETRDAYLERHRFASVFAPVTRAPERMVAELAMIPGVMAVEGRVTGAARIELPDQPLPVAARALSLPDDSGARLNGIMMTAGRMPAPGRNDEIVLLDSFAHARGIVPGDMLEVTLNGARQSFRVTGLARSPEFIISIAPGEFFPDDLRFAVIWMSRDAAAAAFDMKGAFSEALLLTSPDRAEAAILADVDGLLDRYGGAGAFGRADQLSLMFVDDEIDSLQKTSVFLPPIFLAVAAFLLNVVIARIVQSERREIGLMKAFGHRSTAIAAHYLEMVLIVALAGALLGSALGVLAGRALIPVYAHFYKFPFLVYELRLAPFAIGVAASIGAATFGAALTLRSVFRMTPAEAMRPPAPPDFSRQHGGPVAWVTGLMDQPGRMILRQISRQPLRALGSVMGIAAGLALNMAMQTIHQGFDRTMDITLGVADRSDATVTLVRPISATAVHDIARLPGVIEAEARRDVPVRFRHGLYTHEGALTGLAADPQLVRALDAGLDRIEMRGDGVIVARGLARALHLSPGDRLQVEVREGARPRLDLPVVGVADTLLGMPAYMEQEALGRAVGTPDRVTSVALRIDAGRRDAILSDLADMPMVAGVSIKSDALDAFRRMMDEGAGSMRYVMSVVAFAMSFGIVYNAARIAFAERAHELASLRVLGFTRAEVALVLVGELVLLCAAAVPLGIWLSQGLVQLVAAAFSNETYQIDAPFSAGAAGSAVLVMLAALAVSVALIRHNLDRMDMVSALKARE